jgi:hypothetical protein
MADRWTKEKPSYRVHYGAKFRRQGSFELYQTSVTDFSAAVEELRRRVGVDSAANAVVTQIYVGEEIEVSIDADGVQKIYGFDEAHGFYLSATVPTDSSAPAEGYKHSLLIDLLVPATAAEDMHANLEEMHIFWVDRHGVRKARWVRRAQIALMISGLWLNRLIGLTERLLKVTRLSG